MFSALLRTPSLQTIFNALCVCVLVTAVYISASAQEEPASADDAVAFFNQGQDAHEKGNLDDALAFYAKALAIIPDFPEAELQRGNAFLSAGKIDAAEKAFRKAVELRKDWTLALANLGSVLVQRNQFAEAEKILSKAIALDELNFPAYSAMTDLRLRTNASSAVLQDLLDKIKVLTAKAKPMASVWASRAALEHALGDIKPAKASAAEALELDPKNQTALFVSASIAIVESDPRVAESYIKRLNALVPNSQNVKMLRAKAFLAANKIADALAVLNAIENPSSEVLKLRDKIAAGSSTDTTELEKRLSADPDDATILGRLCSLLRVENPPKALEYCRRASEVEPNNVSHAISYGAALVQAKLYLDAVTLFRRLIPIAPDNATIRANLATALFQLRRFAEAKEEYRWLVNKQPNLAGAYYFLAITHDQLGEYMDAAANYQQFLLLADKEQNKIEIEKVNLRMPALQKQIKDGKGKRND